MQPRRTFLKSTAALPFVLRGFSMREMKIGNDNSWLMPDEGSEHLRTWMAFGATQEIWGRRLLKALRANLVLLASTIAKYEPVSICVRPDERDLLEKQFESLENIELIETELNDIWIRDFGAVGVLDESGKKAAVDFNFNGWGEKQDFASDAKVAARMAEQSGLMLLETELCLEAGGLEVDGQGTAIITESCVINENRNPDWTKKEIEAELLDAIGVSKVIWLPGVRDADITDGHTDFYARFSSPGVVMAHYDPDRNSPEHELTLQHLEILNRATDVNGKKLEVVLLEPPRRVRPKFESEDFCAGYINFYVCNNAVIAMEFGDRKKDGEAKEKLQACYPNREIVMLNVDAIAAGGGGIHCVTQQEPKSGLGNAE